MAETNSTMPTTERSERRLSAPEIPPGGAAVLQPGGFEALEEPCRWSGMPRYVAAEIQCAGKYPRTHDGALIQLRRPLSDQAT